MVKLSPEANSKDMVSLTSFIAVPFTVMFVGVSFVGIRKNNIEMNRYTLKGGRYAFLLPSLYSVLKNPGLNMSAKIVLNSRESSEK